MFRGHWQEILSTHTGTLRLQCGGGSWWSRARRRDCRRFEGRLVKVRCQEPIEGQRVYTGTIRSAGDESFVLAVGERQEVVEIPYVGVSKARLVVDWDRELKGTRGGL